MYRTKRIEDGEGPGRGRMERGIGRKDGELGKMTAQRTGALYK